MNFEESFQRTACFFNPKNTEKKVQLRMPQSKVPKKKRENSLPTTFPWDCYQPKILTKQMVQRRTNTLFNTNRDIKQISTQQSTQESLLQTFKDKLLDINKLKHSNSNYVVPKTYKSIPFKDNSNVINTRESRTSSRCSVVSQGDNKRKIKVNDPYGLFQIPHKSTKTFLNRGIQSRLVDRIFSSRQDSIQ